MIQKYQNILETWQSFSVRSIKMRDFIINFKFQQLSLTEQHSHQFHSYSRYLQKQSKISYFKKLVVSNYPVDP